MDPVPFHVGITTDDLRASMDQLHAALGLTWTLPATGPDVLHSVDGRAQPRPTSCISREGPIHIDLIQGHPGTIWAAARPGIHHFAYWTDDLAGDVESLAGAGWRLEMAGEDGSGAPAGFAFLVRGDGFRIELVDRAGQADYERRLGA